MRDPEGLRSREFRLGSKANVPSKGNPSPSPVSPSSLPSLARPPPFVPRRTTHTPPPRFQRRPSRALGAERAGPPRGPPSASTTPTAPPRTPFSLPLLFAGPKGRGGGPIRGVGRGGSGLSGQGAEWTGGPSGRGAPPPCLPAARPPRRRSRPRTGQDVGEARTPSRQAGPRGGGEGRARPTSRRRRRGVHPRPARPDEAQAPGPAPPGPSPAPRRARGHRRGGRSVQCRGGPGRPRVH